MVINWSIAFFSPNSHKLTNSKYYDPKFRINNYNCKPVYTLQNDFSNRLIINLLNGLPRKKRCIQITTHKGRFLSTWKSSDVLKGRFFSHGGSFFFFRFWPTFIYIYKSKSTNDFYTSTFHDYTLETDCLNVTPTKITKGAGPVDLTLKAFWLLLLPKNNLNDACKHEAKKQKQALMPLVFHE